AGGRPVVSTAIADVIRHYGELEGVKVARTPDEFVAACEAALTLAADPNGAWLAEVDKALAELSWSQTFCRMSALIDQAILKKHDEAEARLWTAPMPAIRPAGR